MTVFFGLESRVRPGDEPPRALPLTRKEPALSTSSTQQWRSAAADQGVPGTTSLSLKKVALMREKKEEIERVRIVLF